MTRTPVAAYGAPMTPHGDLTWPSWVHWMTAAFAVTIAALTPFVRGDSPSSAVEVALAAVAVVPWLVEAAGKRLPRPVFAVGVLVPLALLNLAVTPTAAQPNHDAQLSLMLAVMVAGQLAASTPWRSALVFTALAFVVPLVRFAGGTRADDSVFWGAGILLATGTGMALRRLQIVLVELNAAQSALAHEATLQERRRIAREVHDVIAHSLTVSMLHITAARLSLRRDTVETEEALAEAERLGRQALNDVRRTVGLLHDDAGGSTATALPTARDIPELTQTYVAAGLDVTLSCSADLSSLSDASGLALYRAVQEGLSNVVKHAPGAAVTVSVTNDADRVVVDIHNDIAATASTASAAGIGLRGMRERVEALGGSVSAGPRGTRWVTSCAIPVESR